MIFGDFPDFIFILKILQIFQNGDTLPPIKSVVMRLTF
jgi:hypothetical protein